MAAGRSPRMIKRALMFVALVVAIGALTLFGIKLYSDAEQTARRPVTAGQGPRPVIDAPRIGPFPLVDVAKAVGWGPGERPTAAPGLAVRPFATGLDHPRWLLPLPNGDVLVAESAAPAHPGATGLRQRIERWVMRRVGAGGPSPDRIVLLRDADGDGVAESRSVLADGLHSPFGMALVGDTLFVANTDALVKLPFTPGQTRIAAAPVKVADLPAGPIDYHWTKNVLAAPDGRTLYVTVGSNSNVGDHGMAAEQGRAAVWEVDPRTGGHRIFAGGIRNPNGLGWEPRTRTLWTVANERDGLGSDIVPDYLTQVQFGGFYGWPWYYWGGVPDDRPKDPDVADQQDAVTRPDYALGSHTGSLGLAFADGARLGPRFAEGAFVGQHGSWNRKPMAGYKVVFVAFRDGRPVGLPVDVLTGFLDEAHGRAHGRPVGVALDRTGALLVADDVGNAVWRVSAAPAVETR